MNLQAIHILVAIAVGIAITVGVWRFPVKPMHALYLVAFSIFLNLTSGIISQITLDVDFFDVISLEDTRATSRHVVLGYGLMLGGVLTLIRGYARKNSKQLKKR